MSDPRNVLIVVAHPDPGSFNHALADGAAEALRAAGHRVTVSDLAAERFRADIGPHDVTERADPDRFHVQAEQAHAARHHRYAPDIAREQARVAEADNLILQFPIWWGGPPALLKGWIDRVLSYGFAYVDGRRFDTGLFKGRRALISVTTGGTPERFSDNGVYGPIEPLLMPTRKLALEYMGYEVADLCVAYGVPRTTAETRQASIDALAQAALDMAARPVTRTEAWRTALDEVPEGAWRRKG
ncbi:NAD(P)H-dependent oxidoreductase [Pseudodonghicola xiamenensis]|uniref:NAD(P)H dehydrogenase n=1 Tax=Pseudodonghicola xiamenensis TaxID=337702 RepID=A0A8J3MBL1_9RHOB|nr:NAD(P)H-dependent oxidoreductase [Pseudodonghicola xiamenensis]GHG79641.1 NAD(P)H dehydrogenase [Pseudodonghicola xiamenensis]